jgi:hypothetical protein
MQKVYCVDEYTSTTRETAPRLGVWICVNVVMLDHLSFYSYSRILAQSPDKIKHQHGQIGHCWCDVRHMGRPKNVGYITCL